MKSYERFIFESYRFDPQAKKIELHYSLDGEVTFTETLLLPFLDSKISADNPALDCALFALHLIGGISYYKTCLPKTIEIKSGALTPQEAEFWNDVYENGLGEFFYKNEIDFRGLIRFPSVERQHVASLQNNSPDASQPVLVPLGGGKDSLVTIELLKRAKIPATLFRMGTHPFITQQAHTARLPLISVERHLDGHLFKLNAEGALNGHIPITAYLSFLSVIVAMLTNHRAVIFSSERSASEGNTKLFGKEINHQWSKSLAFEQSLQQYLTQSVGTTIPCFSLLRPLSELHIAKMLSAYPQYFETFTSCNANWKIVKEKSKERWCRKCPKCAFSFAIMSAFIGKPALLKIFGGNLFEDESLLPLYRELLGISGHKPFECVGTPEETKAALHLAHERWEFAKTPVMKLFEEEVQATFENPVEVVERLLQPAAEHAVPSEYRTLIPWA